MNNIYKDLITVIIPCYNHSQYLKDSIISIQNQTYNNLEIIVVNDGSTPEHTENITSIVQDLQKEDKRIKYLNFDQNYGKWYALNKAIEISNGLIITSHDADDVSLKQRIEFQYKAMIATKSIHNLCSFYHCYSQQDIEKYKDLVFDDIKINVLNPENVYGLVMLGFKNGINHYYSGDFETAGTTAMFLKDIWTLGLKFNPPKLGMRVLNSEDSDFNFRVTSLLQKTTFIQEKLYCYRRFTSTNNEDK